MRRRSQLAPVSSATRRAVLLEAMCWPCAACGAWAALAREGLRARSSSGAARLEAGKADRTLAGPLRGCRRAQDQQRPGGPPRRRRASRCHRPEATQERRSGSGGGRVEGARRSLALAGDYNDGAGPIPLLHEEERSIDERFLGPDSWEQQLTTGDPFSVRTEYCWRHSVRTVLETLDPLRGFGYRDGRSGWGWSSSRARTLSALVTGEQPSQVLKASRCGPPSVSPKAASGSARGFLHDHE